MERFVRQQARRVSQTNGITEDDLSQSGYLALVAAVNSYDPTQGMSFIGWLVLHLKTAFAKAGGWRSRKRDPLSTAYSLDAPVNEDGATLGDLQSGPGGLEEAEDQIWREQLHEALERALAALPEEQSDTLRRRYYRRQTLDQVAADVGVYPQTVRQREAQALRQPRISRSLREFIEERTPYYLHVGVSRFNATGSSAVEEAVMVRERLAGSYYVKESNTYKETSNVLCDSGNQEQEAQHRRGLSGI